ncbi:MAG: XAC2610-related protein [Pyrinomonadaceae bacterium]
MKKFAFFLILLFPALSFSQQTFDLKDASKYFDIKVKVANCDDTSCKGKALFSFYKKGGSVSYQVIDLEDTYVDLSEGGVPAVNQTLLYDKQSIINIGDYNFDGMEDVAICNGTNGSYGMPSYSIYLSSRAAKKFVYNAKFSDLGFHLGMFQVLKDKKQLETFDKSGCCWHVTTRYSVVNNRPVKVFEEIEDATIEDDTKIKITTKTLVKGKWTTKVKYEKREQ